MAKKEKAAKKAAVKGTREITPEEKSKMKAELKALKAERDAAITEGDKKKLKAARYKLKRLKGKLRHVTVPAPAAPAAEAKPEAAA